MPARRVSLEHMTCLLEDLSEVLDFDQDLPSNVFIGDGFKFWFFERPILNFVDVFLGLVSASISQFESDVLVKFSGRALLANSCFSISDGNVEKDSMWIIRESEDFLGGTVDYPIIFFNRTYDWIALESVREEFGVIGVKNNALHKEFVSYLNTALISREEIISLASGTSVDSMTARAFVRAYFT